MHSLIAVACQGQLMMTVHINTSQGRLLYMAESFHM